MSGAIFINYRRGDEPGFTQALLGRLEQAFPAERLFIDVDSIPPGEDFVRMLEAQVAQCDAMLAVIGDGWLEAKDERGARRLDDPTDFVRIEIESALKQGKRVIPVLVNQARMPRLDELPQSLQPLATRNAVRLTHERFRADVQGLVKSLHGALEEAATRHTGAFGTMGREPLKPSQSARRVVLAVCGLGIILAGAVGIWLAKPHFTLEPQPAAPVQSAAVQPIPAPVPAPAPAVQPALGAAGAPPQTGNAMAPAASPDAAGLEVAFWNSIKDQKNPQLFEAYLKRYPNGAFADIARITLDGLKTAALTPPPQQIDDSVPVTDPVSLNELRERLYELNFDPGPADGPLTDADHEAIREFQQQINVPPTGVATMGLLRRLRELGGLKPWGAIVYGRDNGKWGMAWDEAARKAAVAQARVSCGDAASCPVEISFFGTECGVFAYSGSNWAITARDDIGKAKDAALVDCGKQGKSCQVVASVCADGAERSTAK